MIVNLGSHRLRRYDSRNWLLEEWREPAKGRGAKSNEAKWRSCDRYFQSIGAAMTWVAEHELLDEDAEVDLAGAIREYGTIVDRIKGDVRTSYERDTHKLADLIDPEGENDAEDDEVR